MPFLLLLDETRNTFAGRLWNPERCGGTDRKIARNPLTTCHTASGQADAATRARLDPVASAIRAKVFTVGFA